MALIFKTIGVLGDYVDPEAAYTFLAGLGLWADDYDFDLLDTVNISSWPNIGLASGRVQQNGHSVRFHCSFNEANPTRPDLWKAFVYDNAASKFDYKHETGATANDVQVFENIPLIKSAPGTLAMLSFTCWSSNEGTTFTIRNLFVKGSGVGTETGISCGQTKDFFTLENILAFDLLMPLWLRPTSFSGGDNFPDRKHVKNVTVHTFPSGVGITIGNFPGNNIKFENVFSFGGFIGDAWDDNVAGSSEVDRLQFFNCGDDDNSLVTNIIVSQLIIDNHPNVDPVINMQSIDLNDLGNGYLELIEGNYVTKVDETNAFSGEAPDLGINGKNSGLTLDFYGRAIPGVSGLFSIGAFQQQYAFDGFIDSGVASDAPTIGQDIKLSIQTHDLFFQSNDIVMVRGIDHLSHKLKIKLLFFFGEWFLDTTKGMDFFNVIFIDNPNLNAIDNMVKVTIVDTPGVLELLEYTSDFTPGTRTFFISFKVNTIYGEISFQETLSV